MAGEVGARGYQWSDYETTIKPNKGVKESPGLAEAKQKAATVAKDFLKDGKLTGIEIADAKTAYKAAYILANPGSNLDDVETKGKIDGAFYASLASATGIDVDSLASAEYKGADIDTLRSADSKPNVVEFTLNMGTDKDSNVINSITRDNNADGDGSVLTGGTSDLGIDVTTPNVIAAPVTVPSSIKFTGDYSKTNFNEAAKAPATTKGNFQGTNPAVLRPDKAKEAIGDPGDIKKFQESIGAKPDGAFGPETLSKLAETYTAALNATPPDQATIDKLKPIIEKVALSFGDSAIGKDLTGLLAAKPPSTMVEASKSDILAKKEAIVAKATEALGGVDTALKKDPADTAKVAEIRAGIDADTTIPKATRDKILTQIDKMSTAAVEATKTKEAAAASKAMVPDLVKGLKDTTGASENPEQSVALLEIAAKAGNLEAVLADKNLSPAERGILIKHLMQQPSSDLRTAIAQKILSSTPAPNLDKSKLNDTQLEQIIAAKPKLEEMKPEDMKVDTKNIVPAMKESVSGINNSEAVKSYARAIIKGDVPESVLKSLTADEIKQFTEELSGTEKTNFLKKVASSGADAGDLSQTDKATVFKEQRKLIADKPDCGLDSKKVDENIVKEMKKSVNGLNDSDIVKTYAKAIIKGEIPESVLKELSADEIKQFTEELSGKDRTDFLKKVSSSGAKTGDLSQSDKVTVFKEKTAQKDRSGELLAKPKLDESEIKEAKKLLTSANLDEPTKAKLKAKITPPEAGKKDEHKEQAVETPIYAGYDDGGYRRRPGFPPPII